MDAVVEILLGVDGTAAYVVIGLLAFGEAAALVGLFLPGETAVLLGGVLASQGRVSLGVMLLVAAAAAVAGDSAGYEMGRRWGPRLLSARMLRRHQPLVRRTQDYLAERGGVMVFLGRWVGVLRALVPGLAGMSRMSYGRFLLFNVLGGVAWAAVFTLLGFAAGESFERVEAASGRASWLLAAVVAATLGLRWGVRRLRSAA